MSAERPRRDAPPKSGPPAATRPAALALLTQVLDEKATLDDALDWGLSARGPLHDFDPRDRAFVRLLVTTTLRRLRQIDAVIDKVTDRPVRPRATHHALRLGIAQLLYLRTPPHAAVTTTVALVAEQRLRGFINAVLRRIAAEADAFHASAPAGTPDWLLAGWTAAYGEATAQAIANAHLEEPPLDITVKDPTRLSFWRERLAAEQLPTGSLRLKNAGPIPELRGYKEGAWWVQDAAAALPARLLGAATGRSVIDLCAAPGGKTAQLAATGARVIALDIAAGRLRQLKDNLDRLSLRAMLLNEDAATWSPVASGFGLADAVLLDAPCSATGTIRRHPDIPFNKTAEDVQRMVATQDRLLANAATMVKPGGTIVYCSCSLEPAEGPARVAAFLAATPGFRREPVTAAEIGGSTEFVTPEGDLRTLPCHWPELGGLDGFYAARLVRAA